MSDRQAGPVSGAATRVKIAGAGAAGLAVVFAVAPMAHAAPSAKPGKPTPASAAKKPAAKTAPAATKRIAPMEPNYGSQKYRVGVQIKSGAYVPTGTTTAGTKVTVTETGPEVPGGSRSFTCTTDASTMKPGSTATFCKVPMSMISSQRAKLTKMAKVRPSLTIVPSPSGVPGGQQFVAEPGDTVTLKQKTVNPNLVIDPATATIKPCLSPIPLTEVCGTLGGDGGFASKSTDVIFDDAGLPPKAVNDSAKTDAGKSVAIDVTKNDTTHGAALKSLSVATVPKHGTAKVGSGNIRYTPKAGFSGTDTFRYTITTANGSSTATVTVLVVAPPPPATPNTSSNEPLANTGGNTRSLMTIALGLLGAGAGTTVLGRRRRPIARSGRVG